MNNNYFWEIQRSLYRIKEQSEQLLQPFCGQYGITPLQLRVLLSLKFEGGQTLGQLADNTGIASANLSTLCKRMAGQGFVTRQRQQQDERLLLIALSAQGGQLVADFCSRCATVDKLLKEESGPPCGTDFLSRLHALSQMIEQSDLYGKHHPKEKQ